MPFDRPGNGAYNARHPVPDLPGGVLSSGGRGQGVVFPCPRFTPSFRQEIGVSGRAVRGQELFARRFRVGANRLIFASLAVLAMVPAMTACTQQVPKDSQGVPLLKDVFKREFMIGAAVDFRSANGFGPREMEILTSQFNILTPENSMKPQIQPAPGRFNWGAADRLVTFCVENGIQVHGHTLAWHAQTPGWFFRGDDGQPVTREVAIDRLREHIHAVVGRYKGRVYSWDVVNEAINDGGNGDGENLRDSPWVKAIGPEYITLAFKFAHEADPDAKLYYNDYNIESGNKHKSSLLLLRRLIREGTPIDGVGIQGHWSLSYTPYGDIDRAIADYKELGLKVSISELDITIGGQGGGQLNPAGGPAATGPATAQAATAPGAARGPGAGRGPGIPATPDQLQAQAEAYARLFRIFLKHRDAVERVTFWGLNDRRTWRPGQHPLLFDGANRAKPAIFSITETKLR
jgi:GH35 family endo-1,4-beta-xylanase